MQHESSPDGPDVATLTIARLARVLESHAGAELTLPQYRVLGLLASGDERTSRLASRLDLGKPTLSALADALVGRGLVTREAVSGDRRSVRLAITDAGRAAVSDAAAAYRAVLDDILGHAGAPAADLESLDDLRRALDRRWAERRAAASRLERE